VPQMKMMWQKLQEITRNISMKSKAINKIFITWAFINKEVKFQVSNMFKIKKICDTKHRRYGM
jgi:hypothetical protein